MYSYSWVLKMTVSMAKAMEAASPRSGFNSMVRKKVTTQISCSETDRSLYSSFSFTLSLTHSFTDGSSRHAGLFTKPGGQRLEAFLFSMRKEKVSLLFSSSVSSQ